MSLDKATLVSDSSQASNINRKVTYSKKIEKRSAKPTFVVTVPRGMASDGNVCGEMIITEFLKTEELFKAKTYNIIHQNYTP